MSLREMPPFSDSDVGERKQQSGEPSHDRLAYVLIHNDDVTPFNYVIATLGDVFMLSEEMAEHVAWTAHRKGTAVVVVRPRREAEKLAGVAQQRARFEGYPLTFSLEQG